MNRLDALFELLEILLRQEHDSFEVVVVEQSRDITTEQRAKLDAFADDPRIRICPHPPLGGPGARNEGVRSARGDIVILIDDDDLPVDSKWIANHEAAHQTPGVVAVNGQQLFSPDEEGYVYGPLPRFMVRRRCMSYSLLCTPYTLARFNEDVDRVGWIHGTNSSFRKDAAMRAGLWDTDVRSLDEHSLAFKLQRILEPDEYLVFRTGPKALRRIDIAGGMDKRRSSLSSEFNRNFQFIHRILGRHFPYRVKLLYPLYLGWVLYCTVTWVWSGSRQEYSFARRLKDFAMIPFALPRAWWMEVRRPKPPAQ